MPADNRLACAEKDWINPVSEHLPDLSLIHICSAEEIQEHIEDGLICQVYPAVQTTDIFGNSGTHQATLAAAAVVFNRNPETKEWIDFCFRSGKEEPGNCTGGNINEVLIDRVDRDGFGSEASPGYNSGWLYYFLNVADVLDGYQIEGLEAADLYQNPKFRKMFSSLLQLIFSDIYTPVSYTHLCRLAGSQSVNTHFTTVKIRSR